MASSIDKIDRERRKGGDRDVLFANYAGIRAEVDLDVPLDEVWIEDEGLVLVGPDLAIDFHHSEQPGREQFLRDLSAITKAWPRKAEGGDLWVLTGMGGDEVAKYTVGNSSQPIDQAGEERRRRKGIAGVVPDRIRDLQTESRGLVQRVAALDDMTEGQYVEFQSQRLDLRRRLVALREEVDQIEADLELVHFACEEAEQRGVS